MSNTNVYLIKTTNNENNSPSSAQSRSNSGVLSTDSWIHIVLSINFSIDESAKFYKETVDDEEEFGDEEIEAELRKLGYI